jgi:hypothetical protein
LAIPLIPEGTHFMVKQYNWTACLVVAGLLLTACSRNKTDAPQAANQAASPPQVEIDHGDNDDSQAAAAPEIVVESPRFDPATRSRDSGSAESDPPAAEESPEEPSGPSIFRSVGRALTRGVVDAVKQGPSDDSSEPPAADDASEQEAAAPEAPQE